MEGVWQAAALATSSPGPQEGFWGFQPGALQRAACSSSLPPALSYTDHPDDPTAPTTASSPPCSSRFYSPSATGWSPAQHPGKREPSTPVNGAAGSEVCPPAPHRGGRVDPCPRPFLIESRSRQPCKYPEGEGGKKARSICSSTGRNVSLSWEVSEKEIPFEDRFVFARLQTPRLDNNSFCLRESGP